MALIIPANALQPSRWPMLDLTEPLGRYTISSVYHEIQDQGRKQTHKVALHWSGDL